MPFKKKKKKREKGRYTPTKRGGGGWLRANRGVVGVEMHPTKESMGVAPPISISGRVENLPHRWGGGGDFTRSTLTKGAMGVVLPP
jgi:hypothetical protein